MKKSLVSILCLVLIACLLPLSAMAEWESGKVVQITSKSAVNVYSHPQRANKYYITEAPSGCCYAYIDKTGDWYEVWYEDGVRGYIPTKYSAVKNGYVWREYGSVSSVVLNLNRNPLIVRGGSSIESRELGAMPVNTILEHEGSVWGWHRVWYDGGYGYVAGNRSAVITGSMTKLDLAEADATSGATR